MTGTWEQLYRAGITKIRWPGWRGYIVISRDDGGKWHYTNYDGNGRREQAGQRDYRPYAKRRAIEQKDNEQ